MGYWDRIWKVELQMGGYQIDDGSEVFDGAKASGLALHRLDDAIESLGCSIGYPRLEVGDYTIPVGADGLGDLLHFRDFRAGDPTAPPFEVPLGDGWVCLLHDRSQGIQMVEGLAGLQFSGTHLTPDLSLFLAQFVLTFEHGPANALEFLGEFPTFPSSNLVQGLRDQLHHVEVVEDQQRSTKFLGDSLNVGRAHVRADRPDLLRGQPTATQVVGKVPETPAVPSLHGQEDTRPAWVR